MTLNSYRDPGLRDRRSVFARHPLSTVLGTVVSAFLLLVPIGVRVGQSAHLVVRTAPLPGGVVDAGVLVDAATTSTTAAITVPPSAAVPETAPATEPTTIEPVATTRKTPRSTTTVKRKPATTVKPKSATTAAKPKTTTATAAPKTTTTAAKPKPTTTQATTTTTVAPPVAYSPAQSEAVIRRIWPDDLEDQAVAIATRESNLHNVSHNYCCFGLFQINFVPHQKWLATMGVTRPEQLYDPTVNTTVAYRLYLLSGWAPWGG
jgi:hypothetical protein